MAKKFTTFRTFDGVEFNSNDLRLVARSVYTL